MGTTNNKMARALLPAIVAVSCVLATVIAVNAVVTLARAAPHVGDIVAFEPSATEFGDDTTRLLVRRQGQPDCILDLKVLHHSGGSLVVENEIAGQTNGFRVHWGGERTSADTGNCGSDADLIVDHHDLDILALSTGGYGIGAKHMPVLTGDIAN